MAVRVAVSEWGNRREVRMRGSHIYVREIILGCNSEICFVLFRFGFWFSEGDGIYIHRTVRVVGR